MLKRALSVVLTMGMILSVLAVPAFAATTVDPIVFEAENYVAAGDIDITREQPKTNGTNIDYYFAITEGNSYTPSVSDGAFRVNGGNWTAYNVEIPESGAYTIYATIRCDNVANIPGITVYESNTGFSAIADVKVAATSPVPSYSEQVIGTAYLEKGTNYLRFMNNYKGWMVSPIYFDSFKLVKSDESLTYKRFIEAELYQRSDMGTQTRRVRMEGGPGTYSVALNTTQWVEYDVYVAQPGFYKLGAEIGCTGITISATCNDTESFTATVPTTDGVTKIEPMEFGLVELKAGKNVIRVSNPSNIIYFDRLTLEKSNLKTSIDVNLADADATLTNATVSEGTLTLAAGGSATYNISTDFYGSYKISGTGDCAVELDGQAVSDDIVVLQNGAHTLSVSSESGATINGINLTLYARSAQYVAKDAENSWDNDVGAEGKPGASGCLAVQAGNVSFQPNDWLEYTIEIPEEGKYMINTYGSAASGSRLKILTDEGATTRLAGNVNNDGNYSTYSLTTLGAISFEKGNHDIRILTDSSSNGGNGYLFNHFAVTYVGEAEYNDSVSVADATSTYDASNGGAALSVIGTPKHVSTGVGDYIVFDVYAQKSGVYDLSISQAAIEMYGAPTLVVVNEDNGYSLRGDVVYTGTASSDLYNFTNNRLGKIVLSKGMNTLRVIVATQGQFHLASISVNYSGVAPVVAIDKQAEDYTNTTGQGADFNDVTPNEVDDGYNDVYGDGVEFVELPDDNHAVNMEKTEWFNYSVEADVDGYYNVKMLAKTDATAKTMKLYTANETITAEVTGLYADGYVIFNLGDISLNAGTNTLKVELIDGANVLVDKLMLSNAAVSFTTTNGKTSVSGSLNGLFEGKAAMCILASYDINDNGVRRLVDIDKADIVKGGVNDAINLTVSSGEEAKLFIWDSGKLIGSVFIN